MRLDTSMRLLSLALIAGCTAFACSSDDKPSDSSTGVGGASVTGSPATSTPSTAAATTGNGGSSSSNTTAAANTMGGASAAVTNDAVTIDSTSSTSTSTMDSTSSSTSMGGSSTDGGAGGASSMGAGGTSSGGEFSFSTPAFEGMEACTCEGRDNCDTFPQENTNFGNNTSPEFNWSGAPDGTQGFAIVLQDIANGYVHWAIWNIPGSSTMLPSGLPSSAMLSDPAGAQQATAFNQMGYFGPGACNVYEFTLYALDTATFTPSSTTDTEAIKASLDGAGALDTLSISAAADEAYCNGGGTCDI